MLQNMGSGGALRCGGNPFGTVDIDTCFVLEIGSFLEGRMLDVDERSGYAGRIPGTDLLIV